MPRTPRHALIERLMHDRAAYTLDHETPHVHRDMRSGGLRAAVFGISDGLVSNVSLVLGIAGANPGPGVVRLAGLAGLLGGSFSMAAGEYVSMRAQREAFERELEVERVELEAHPHAEQRELEQIYVRRGMTPAIAEQAAGEMMANPETALSTHAREELGLDPQNLGSPVQAALASFGTFALGALLPLLPYLTGASGNGALFAAIVLTALGALGTGTVLSFVTQRGRFRSAMRSLLICAVAGAATYGIGAAIGVSTH